MNIFAMLVFEKMMGFSSGCKNYKEDTEEYKKCIKAQILANEHFEKFKQENKELLENFLKLIEEDSSKIVMANLYYIYNKIDDDIDLLEQERVLNEYFSFLSDIDNYEFDFS